MSLFESASLCITPNGTKASKLYAIKPTSGAGDLSVTRATTATRVNSAGLIESVAVNVPRLDYTDSTCPSILVEPQRTNLFLRSQEFDNSSWTKSNTTVNANQTTSPDGTTTADKLNDIIIGSSNDYLLNVQSALSYTSGTPYTVSFYAKNIDRRYIYIRFVTNAFGTNKYAYFDLQNGVISKLDTGATANITSVGNGWFRCTATYTATVTTSTIYGVYIGLSADGLNNFYVNASVKSVYIWGAQLEAGSYATSYIPTTSASVTRNADVISKTGISSLIGQTEGTLYTEVKVNKLIGTASRYIFHVSDGTANNRIYIAFSGASSNILRARIFNGGTLQCSIDSSTITNTGTYKLALAYKNNDIVFYINGVQIGTDTSATIPTCSRVDIGQNYAGASQFSDNVSLSTLFKTRLTNNELAELTTI